MLCFPEFDPLVSFGSRVLEVWELQATIVLIVTVYWSVVKSLRNSDTHAVVSSICLAFDLNGLALSNRSG